MHNPKLSIIVPVYNAEEYLNKCLESLLNQTYKDYEIILVDDGSKDNCPEICDSYAKEYPEIHVIHKENGGLSDARNFGIEKATGDFYLFIDSDDILHKDFCKTLVDLQEKYNSDITSTDIITFYKSETIDELNKKEYNCTETVLYGKDIVSEYFCPKKNRFIYHGLCMKMYKKELFNNLRFEKGRLHEDLYITYKLLDKSNCFVYIPLPFYYYYKNNSSSITGNYKEKNLHDEFDAIQQMINYYKDDNEITDELGVFITRHYYYLLFRIKTLPKTEYTTTTRKIIKKWLKNNVRYKNFISQKEIIKMEIKSKLTHLYIFLSSLINKHD